MEQSNPHALIMILEKGRKKKCHIKTVHFVGNKSYKCYTAERNLGKILVSSDESYLNFVHKKESMKYP